MSDDPFLVAAVQAAPVFLDRAATVEKACALIAEAGARGARLVAFPEGFIPAYPLWVWFIPAGETQALRELYSELLDQSITIPSEATDRLCAAARDAGVHVAIGINERNSEASGTTLYNSLLYIGADGRILGCHRKLVPTAGERLVHGQGDGSTLEAYDLPIGTARRPDLLGELHAARALRDVRLGSADLRRPDLGPRRALDLDAAAHRQGGARLRPRLLQRHAAERRARPLRLQGRSTCRQNEWLNPGDSTIVDPDGKFLVEPVRNREEILYAEVDPRHLRGPRWQLDVAGHYGRPDVFELTVRREPRPMIRVMDGEEGAGGGPPHFP